MRLWKWLNSALLFIALLFLLLYGLSVLKGTEVSRLEGVRVSKRFPEPPFAMETDAYAVIGEPVFRITLNPVVIQLPDLRKHLRYRGRNERPDADAKELVLHFSLRGGEEVKAVLPAEPTYVVYDGSGRTKGYRFSPDNQETALWFTADLPALDSTEVTVRVSMRDVEGNPVTEPAEHATVKLKAGKQSNSIGKWTINDFRVDASLLARMRARWYGQDRFLQVHGGEDFAAQAARERIDFGQGEDAYAIYVQEGDVAAWVDRRWEVREAGPETREYPLLVVKKLNGKLMNLEIWDPEGKARVPLNLIKSRSTGVNLRILKSLRFLGTKTRTQAIVEANDERLTIERNDWLLHQRSGWSVLETIEQIDAFVERQLQGELFVYNEVSRQDGRQVLLGHAFNATRSEMQKVLIPLSTGDGPAEVELIPEASDSAPASQHSTPLPLFPEEQPTEDSEREEEADTDNASLLEETRTKE